MSTYMNPMLSNPDELTTQRFYLRKIEGADILLADETNFFKQELHKWAPVAPEPPPKTSISLSTRKPRPTKQQKLMYALGINDPADLPEHMRPRQLSANKRKNSDAHARQPHPHSSATGSRSHTPSGFPHHSPMVDTSNPDTSIPPMSASSAAFDFNDMGMSSSLRQDNTYTPNDPFGEAPAFRQTSPKASAMDPALFSTPVYARAEQMVSPLVNTFGSGAANPDSGGAASQTGAMDSMFADLTNQDDSIGPHGTDGAEADVDGQAFVSQFLHEDGEDKP